VLGAGLWGTVLANCLARKGRPVSVWEFFPELAESLEATRSHPHIPHLELAHSVRVTSDLAAAVRGADTIFAALPSAHVRATARKLRGCLPRGRRAPCIVNAAKGMEPGTLKTMGEVIEEELRLPAGRVFTLSGPSFAREVARGVPTALVLAGPRSPAAERLRRLLNSGALRVELSRDRKGVELGGSLKNILAIGCGILDGLKAGANTKAALMTRGIEEMARLVAALGGREESVRGLAGVGDLIATGTSPESRNRALGEKLGSGKHLEAALREILTVTEGVESAKSGHELAESSGVRCPVITAIWQIVHRGAPPRRVLEAMGFDGYAGRLEGGAGRREGE